MVKDYNLKKTAVSIFQVSTVANRIYFALLSRMNLNACLSDGVLRQFRIWELMLIVIVINRIPAQRQKIADDIAPLNLARVDQIEMILLIWTCNMHRTSMLGTPQGTPPLGYHNENIVIQSFPIPVRCQDKIFIGHAKARTIKPDIYFKDFLCNCSFRVFRHCFL